MLTKSFNHFSFWIEDCIVYERYTTIRGRRDRPIAQVLFPDTDRLTDEQIELINNQLQEQQA